MKRSKIARAKRIYKLSYKSDHTWKMANNPNSSLHKPNSNQANSPNSNEIYKRTLLALPKCKNQNKLKREQEKMKKNEEKKSLYIVEEELGFHH